MERCQLSRGPVPTQRRGRCVQQQHAKAAGADAALIVTPYYNKPTQDGLYAHYMKIADTVDIPIVVYNVPGRCGTDILSPTIARLAEHPNIVALKEATGELKRASEVVSLVS